jgi:hypothetical protein
MRRRGAAAAALALLAAAAGLGACGESNEPAAQRTASTAAADAIELTVLYDDGSGRKTTGTLTCRGAERRAAGALDGSASAAELCAQARGNADLLTSAPDKTRACTQVYGGPQTAVVRGTIAGEKVNRRFTRTNGCELADFTRASRLLAP